MYIKLKGWRTASGSVGLFVRMAVWAPMKDRRRNMKVPQNSPKRMTKTFLMELEPGRRFSVGGTGPVAVTGGEAMVVCM
jgi:hypothetical protein